MFNQKNCIFFLLVSTIYSNTLESDLIHYNNKFYSPSSHVPYSGNVIQYYSNKLISYEGKYNHGLRHGDFIYYYEDGFIHRKEKYERGNKAGLWIEYDINGNTIKETYYKNGLIDSNRTVFFQLEKVVKKSKINKKLNNDTLVLDKKIKEEKLNGEYLTYYKNGNIKSKKYYLENMLEGEQFEYYKSGRLFRTRVYSVGFIDTLQFTHEYYESGQLLSKHSEVILNNKIFKNGYFISYHANGIKLLEGEYRKNKKKGIWSKYYDTGQLYYQLNYDNLTSDNSLYVEFYHKNGQIFIETNIIDMSEDYFDGNYIKYYDSGEVHQKGYYKNNIKEGLWQEFYKNGNILSKINFVDQTGMYYSFYQSEKLLSEVYFINGKKNGTWVEYYQNGHKKSQMEYLNGEVDINTPLISYTDNGELHIKKFIKIIDDKIINDGRYIEYFLSGEIKSEGTYLLGNKEGKWMEWYADGSLYSKLILEGENGNYTSYYPSGEILILGGYKNLKKNGKWNEYYSNGNKKLEYYYLNDSINPNKLCYHWYESGYKKAEGYLMNSNNEFVWDGQYREFFQSGIIYLVGEYTNGNQNGLWKQFYNNRTLHSEKIYINGIPTGEWLFYNKDGDVVKVENY